MAKEKQQAGFWCSKEEPQYPMPIIQPEPWEGKDDFLSKLASIEATLIKQYRDHCAAYNAAIYMKPAPVVPDCDTVEAYRGWSTCRLCGKGNGNLEYHYMGWQWPEGYIHYLRDHNVRPDEAFRLFVIHHALPALI